MKTQTNSRVDPFSCVGSLSKPEKHTRMLFAHLLYQTKDAYYVKLMDGQTMSIQADAVKSVVWSLKTSE